MSNDSLQPVADDQLRISVDMGPDYPATERVAKALSELSAALLEVDAESSDDVQGFGNFDYTKIEMAPRPFSYDSSQPGHFCSTVGNKQEPYLKIKFD